MFLVVTILAIAFPELTSLLPDSQPLSFVEQLVSDHARALVIGLLPMPLVILLICTVASWTSNYRAHKEIRNHFETRPKRYSRGKTQTPANESDAVAG